MQRGARAALPRTRGHRTARLARGRALIELPWELELGEAWPTKYSLLVAPARLPDGSEVVVKVHLPDDVESVQDIDALLFWDGRGAVRLLDYDRDLRAMLLERCTPGTQLGQEYDDASLEIAAALLRRLWREPPPDVEWRWLEREAERWLVEIPERWERLGRPFDRRLLDAGLDAIRTLGQTQLDVVLCHQDLHGGNILRAQREPWLAIDAKPIVAEPAYDTVALVRDYATTPAIVRRRLDVLAEALDLDRERMLGWGIAKHLAWGLDEDAVHEHSIEEARLMFEA